MSNSRLLLSALVTILLCGCGGPEITETSSIEADRGLISATGNVEERDILLHSYIAKWGEDLFALESGAKFIVPDRYKTIQEAIDSSSTGDTIFVKSGTYSETITLRPNREIRGLTDVPEERPVILAEDDSISPIFNFSGQGMVALTDLVINATQEERFSGGAAVSVRGGVLKMKNCEVLESAAQGILLTGKASAPSELLNTNIIGSQSHAIEVREGASIQLMLIEASSSKGSGLVVDGLDSFALVNDSNFLGNDKNGILVSDGGLLVVKGSATNGNGVTGVAAINRAVIRKLSDHIANDNKEGGIYITSASVTTLEDVEASSNGMHGILLRELIQYAPSSTDDEFEPHASIIRTTTNSNKGNGISIETYLHENDYLKSRYPVIVQLTDVAAEDNAKKPLHEEGEVEVRNLE